MNEKKRRGLTYLWLLLLRVVVLGGRGWGGGGVACCGLAPRVLGLIWCLGGRGCRKGGEGRRGATRGGIRGRGQDSCQVLIIEGIIHQLHGWDGITNEGALRPEGRGAYVVRGGGRRGALKARGPTSTTALTWMMKHSALLSTHGTGDGQRRRRRKMGQENEGGDDDPSFPL